MTMIRYRFQTAAALGLLALSGAPEAGAPKAPPPNPAYVQECGSCHAPYPARMLSAPSWRAVMQGLDRHFGSDASLEPQVLEDISRYLESAARSRGTSRDGRPLLRITETRRFRHEHDEVPARVWRLPSVKSPSNCGACHSSAAAGRFSEHSVHLPSE
ncbi:diheme cytochrome c [Methylocaldum sp. MU1018]